MTPVEQMTRKEVRIITCQSETIPCREHSEISKAPLTNGNGVGTIVETCEHRRNRTSNHWCLELRLTVPVGLSTDDSCLTCGSVQTADVPSVPLCDNYAYLSSSPQTNADIQIGRNVGRHAAIKRKRARLLSSKLQHSDTLFSASWTFLAGQAGGNDRNPRPLPPPPPPHRVPVMGIGALSGPVIGTSSPPLSEKSLPLLHRIAKSIGIWYHAEMDRSMAMGLLTSAEMGCFVLRKSSRENTLALTVRNARPQECDHYLIFLRTNGLQIEGSFLTFQSIPKLIEYYALHLRELPYLLKLPDPIANCTSDSLLETYNKMGVEFWQKFYPARGPPCAQHRRPPPSRDCAPPEPSASSDSSRETGSGCVRCPTASSVDSLVADLRAVPRPPPAAPMRAGPTGPPGRGPSPLGSSKTLSADSLAPSSGAFRSSLQVRVRRSGTGVDTPAYDLMWEARGGVPEAEPSPPAPRAAPDLASLPGFPQPGRFRPKFTFDGFTPRGSASNDGPSSGSGAQASVVYADPIDLLPGTAVPPPPPRRARRPQAASEDSLHLRVEDSIREINCSIDAMEAELRGGHGGDRLPPPPRPRSIPASQRPVSQEAQRDTSHRLQAEMAQVLRRRRLSQYDNVPAASEPSLASLQPSSRQASVASSRGTVFSNPWDASVWHQILRASSKDFDAMEALQRLVEKGGGDGEKGRCVNERPTSDSGDVTPTQAAFWACDKTPMPELSSDDGLGPDDILHSIEEGGPDMVRRAQARISESVQASSSRNVGAAIDKWLEELIVNPRLLFGPKLQSFIECTRDASERNPHSIMRNIRQFMDGIKHYLVQRDETGFQKMIENERKKLATDEFLNVERRLESALYKLILKPLKPHIHNLMVDWHHAAGNLRRVRDNIRLAAKRTPERLGIRNGLQPPSEEDLEQIRQCFKNMTDAYSPLVKLECLLQAVDVMYQNVSDHETNSPKFINTDDLMPIFTYVLVRCELTHAELEAEYMQGLLASKFLLGEGAYYLSTLQAAVTVIKNFHRRPSLGNMTSSYEDLSQLHGVLRVHVLDERTDSTTMKTFPARPTMTARDLSILVAHRCHIFNPQDFSLYHYSNGTETILKDLDLPYKIKVDCEAREEKPCHFLYRRTNAVFALPLGLSCGK